ncbi:MAG: MFS transporter [Anaerolineales bacterium]|nr:MFS transporter [Anaerolineales bacterium]
MISSNVTNRKAAIGLYALAVFFFWGSQYIYLPILPTYLQSKVIDLSWVGFVLSMYGLWQALIRIPLGIAADWWGRRKPFLIAGLALGAWGAWMLGTSNDLIGLTMGRAITGVSTGVWVVLVVAFSALFPPEQAVRASSLVMIANSLGRIVATASTGALDDLGGATLVFFVATGLGLLSAILILPIGETRRAPQPPSVRGIGNLLLRRDVLLPTLLSALMQYVLWSTSFGFFAVLAKQLGATSVIQGMIVTLHIVLAMLGNFVVLAQSQRGNAARLVGASFVLLFIGVLIAALASSLPIFFIAPIFTGAALGIGYPVLMGMSIERVEDSERTMAMGLHQAIYAIGMFIGPALSGVIADQIGLQPMFGITAFASFALGIFGTSKFKVQGSKFNVEP